MSETTGGRVPVVLVRAGKSSLTAITTDEAAKRWTKLGPDVAKELGPWVARLVGASDRAATELGVRTFEMAPGDLKYWDELLRKSNQDGFCLGSMWGEDGKIAKNLRFKEAPASMSGSVARLPIDPIAVATAVAVAQIQADIQRLTAQVEAVGRDVKAIVRHLQDEQQATILAAVETIDEVFARGGSVDSADWARMAHLEQILKGQHRQILLELGQVATEMRPATVSEAKKTIAVESGRVSDLLDLEYYLLRAFLQWNHLLLTYKQQHGELRLGDLEAAWTRMDSYINDATAAVRRIQAADGEISERDWWTKLWSDGLVLGAKKDHDCIEQAKRHRAHVQAATRREHDLVIDGVISRSVLEAPA